MIQFLDARALDLALFPWLAAGYHPSPWLLPLVPAIAVGGPWLCVAIMGWVAWRQPAQRGYVMAMLVACAAAGVAAHAIATALDLPRPFMLGLSPAYIAHGARGSMPSAHASVMFTIALAFALRPGLRNFAIASALAAVVTGWARIYVGVHFPTDIVAGLLLALVIVALFEIVRRLCRRYLGPVIARDGLHVRPPADEAGEPVVQRDRRHA
ncbi:phosphatase PAP2 family protein [Variovorax sp. PBL-E5]|uniref:phosphatase PAP2 family protein n=1 Tax=Variovorax sp. PBL-E5 TaxID=434014 RepID=UPI001315D6D9|nr:phosphatase PAP2 family protein [Variovorax sp. PBL-E5]VTU34210.1 Putative undecaprenyl-diphosphatase YbjG [Variovorax sp. PBL-E5]